MDHIQTTEDLHSLGFLQRPDIQQMDGGSEPADVAQPTDAVSDEALTLRLRLLPRPMSRPVRGWLGLLENSGDVALALLWQRQHRRPSDGYAKCLGTVPCDTLNCPPRLGTEERFIDYRPIYALGTSGRHRGIAVAKGVSYSP